MEIVYLTLVVRAGLVGAIGKYRIQAIHRLAFPRAHLVGMHLVTRGDLLDRLVAAQRFQRYAGLEGCVVICVFLR